MKIAIINGPNLNLLGKREPGIYGSTSFEDYLTELKKNYENIQIEYFQSNIEGEIINAIQQFGFSFDGIIINAGGFSHTSIGIADAIASVQTRAVEVHISNIFAREEYRKNSFVGAKCAGSISGLGLKGYELALLFFMKG